MSERPQSPNTLSLPFVEALYAQYLRDPGSVPPEWRGYFERIAEANGFTADPRLEPSFPRRGLFGKGPSPKNGSSANAAFISAELEPSYVTPGPGESRRAPTPPAPGAPRVPTTTAMPSSVAAFSLIQAYRAHGHLAAAIDPLGTPRPTPADLEPSFHGVSEADLDRTVEGVTLGGRPVRTLAELTQWLRAIYCGPVGIQTDHIRDVDMREWIHARVESPNFLAELSRDEERRVLERLTRAAMFEEFIQRKYVGSKSFSLEGSEALIPLLDTAIESADAQGQNEIVFGMAHRGRLNVLANVLGKDPSLIFHEFEDQDPELYHLRGDVKYHLGYSSDKTLPSGREIHLSLCYNPSHLEYVNPVAIGRMRAKQDHINDRARERGMALLMHGDAAFAGEGIVQETLNLSALPAYATGGTLHVIVNNQIGFTTLPSEGRSSIYASAVARMLQSPVFHVNGEEPAAVIRVARLAMDYRRAFRRDVVIDLYGYRRHGHNEGDEPAFTQPLEYQAINAREPIHVLYRERLVAAGRVTEAEANAMADAIRGDLEAAFQKTRTAKRTGLPDAPAGVWTRYQGGPDAKAPEVETGVSESELSKLLAAQTKLPADFSAHPKIQRGLAQRLEMAEGKRPLDWAAGEALAFATLAVEGYRVRLTGQDTERGTFSHRHAVLHDVKTGARYVPLQHLAKKQADVEIANSPLSEAGCMGFEYGYSLETPDGLVAWEAQFGDFGNAAQVIIDQFLTSGEEKWRRLSGLVLLLPHGYEGMGSEHSSARIERFLQLSARDNIQVAYPTTPAQYFHLLRRQVKRPWRKPLVVMTPKSLLRHPKAVSSMADLATGRFARALRDPDVKAETAKRVLWCTGKIYYELERTRQELKETDTAILRLEQLYPLADETLESLFEGLPKGMRITWVQEEPRNMGAWPYLRARFGESLLGRHPFSVVSRAESATPASGAASSHKIEQERLLLAAFDREPASHGG
jgi:2-oxoglutarate dehydrogenase E1 component